ncbi:hypothetical protein PENSPDRAFT_267061 [Peniophora sp. CONT]|nr:hypothetical protein PENSPDRAFT_267061 [Peniophora sp. CONT]
MQSYGLPIHTKATHPHDFMFVRKGRPQPRLPDLDTQDSCIAILPNDTQVASHTPIRPAQPLPWDDCYLDATYGFPQSCRVTSTGRDYVPVLPILDSEVIRIRRCFQPYQLKLRDLHMEGGVDFPGPFDFVSLASLLSLKDSRIHDNPTPSTQGRPEDFDPIHDIPSGKAGRDSDSIDDDMSIIASEDGVRDAPDSDDGAGEEELHMLLTFESMMMNVGKLRDPVVNVWYDLDVVTEIVDPLHFLEDVKRLHMCVDFDLLARSVS